MLLKASRETAAALHQHATCTFLWIVAGSSRLSKYAAQSFSDPANDVFLSAVSSWVLYLPKISKLHRDPFDRMLISGE
jgi:PIN domain nuclease of toxin-antitoxin system